MRKIVITLLALAPLTVHGGALYTAEARNPLTGEVEELQIGVQNGNIFMRTYGAATMDSIAESITAAGAAAVPAETRPDLTTKLDEMVFNHSRQTAWFDDGGGRVEKMNSDKVKEMTGGRTSVGNSENMQNAMSQYAAAMKQAQQQMANLPADQQQKLKEMGVFGGGTTPSHNPGKQKTYTDNGKRETVGRYQTKGIDEFDGDVLIARHSVVPWSDIEHGNDLRESFDNLEEFYASLIDAAGGKMTRDHLMSTPGATFAALGGMPVKTEEIGPDGVQVERVITLQKVEEQTFNESAFIR